MGMFDTYLPAAQIACPQCQHPLTEWQGKDGPLGLFVWREGEPAPIDQPVDDEIALEIADRNRLRLPETFIIYSYDCPNHRPIEAECTCFRGTWSKTVVLPYGSRARFRVRS